MFGRSIAAALIALHCAAPASGTTFETSAAPASGTTLEALAPDGVYMVRAIRIEGNASLSDRALREVMLTKVPPWYQPWKPAVALNRELLRADLVRVAALLREAGYYAARVAHRLEIEGERVTIVVEIEEGEVARVGEVTIDAVDVAASEREELVGLLALERDDPFTQKAYDTSHARLERFYHERGFAYATVTKAAVVDTADHRVRVTYAIDRGPAAIFGETRVRGTVDVAERLVRREIAYRPGDPYDSRTIDETQARIFGLRLFRAVTVAPANLAERSGIVDVAIDVVEGPQREVKVGIGYGLEDEVRGELRWQHNDFFGGGRQLGVRLKGSAITQAFEGEFRQPYFLHPAQTFVFPLTQSHEDEPGFMVTRTRLAPRIDRKLRPHLKGSFGYNIEYDDLSDVPRATVERLDDFVPRGWVSSLNATLERNTTLDLLDPKEGSVLYLAAEQAGGPWHGNYTFYRAVAEAKGYLPIPGSRTLAGRLRMGVGDGFGQSSDLPMFRRFFAGGVTSTRGYDRSQVGPLDAFGSPVGGRSLLDASVELRTPLRGSVGGVVFFDVGEVRRAPFSWSLDALQYGTGVGVRYYTIVGPLRLDLAFPIDPPPGQPSWKIHFSIGQAF